MSAASYRPGVPGGSQPSRRRRLARAGFSAAGLLTLLVTLRIASGSGQAIPQPSDPSPPAFAVSAFDPHAATEAYLATIPAERRARAERYSEGGYWIALWSTALTVALMTALLHFGGAARLRTRAERLSRRLLPQAMGYFAAFALIFTLVLLPWNAYVGFFRERRYGLMNQSFVGWLRDQVVALGVDLVLGGLAVAVFYWIVRRIPRSWPFWGAAAGVAFTAFVTLVYPLYIEPLSNEVVPLRDEALREPLLGMARAHGLRVNDVWVLEESRRSDRINASAVGLLDTQRLTLNDNLLQGTSPPEIRTAAAHEIGHFVLNHTWEGLVRAVVLYTLALLLIRATFERSVRRWGDRWGVRDIGDLAGLPLLFLLFTLLGFLGQPITNTFARADEVEADAFALNVAREPDGAARLALTSSAFRKVDPSQTEELLFYAHPAPRSRILRAMVWKAQYGGESRDPGAGGPNASP